MKITNQSTLTSNITLPDGNQEKVTTLSNESNTEYMTESFLKVKSSNKTYAKPSEEIEYTITLTNNSDYDITNVNISDTLSTGATFKEGSITVDDTPYTEFDLNTGFDLPNDITKSSTVVVKYIAVVDSSPTVSKITNKASLTYSVNEVENLKENTNEVSVLLVENKIRVDKTSSQSAVIAGQKLTYTISVINEGEIENTDLVLKDPLPDKVDFVEGSVKIDEVEKPGENPVTGISLGKLEKNTTITVKFDVMVK